MGTYLNFRYTQEGKAATQKLDFRGNVVTRLTRDLVGQYYHVFVDNSSIALFHRQLDDNIYATGTLRSNRKMFAVSGE